MRRLILALVIVSGCATTKDDFLSDNRDRARARQETPPPPKEVPGEVERRPAPSQADLAKDAANRANAMRDDVECGRAVSVDEGSGRAAEGWHLLLACTRQGKWRSLTRLLGSPWGQRLQQAEEGERIAVLANVIANRGGVFEADLPVVQRASTPLRSLQEAFGSAAPAGSWVIFRASIAKEGVDKQGRRTVELDEVSRGTQDRKERVDYYDSSRRYVGSAVEKTGSSDFYDDTGNQVIGILPQNIVLSKGQLIFLARVDSLKETPEGRRAFVHVARAFVPGAIMFDVSP